MLYFENFILSLKLIVIKAREDAAQLLVRCRGQKALAHIHSTKISNKWVFVLLQWALQTANCSIGCNSFLGLCHQWAHVNIMDVAINAALLTSIHNKRLSYFCWNFCWCIIWVLELGIRNFRRNSSISGSGNTSFVIAKFSSVDKCLKAWTLNMVIDKDTFTPYSDFFPLLSEELRAGRQSNNLKRLPS